MIIIVLTTTNDNHSVKILLMITIVLNTTNDNHSGKY